MNNREPITASDSAASVAHHYRDAFEAIGTPISRAYQQSMALLLLADDMQGCKGWTPELYAPQAISFLIDELFETLRTLDAQHTKLHNAAPDWRAA